MTYCAYYDAFDNGRWLFVKPLRDCTKNEVAVFTGTEAECRRYTIDTNKRGML